VGFDSTTSALHSLSKMAAMEREHTAQIPPGPLSNKMLRSAASVPFVSLFPHQVSAVYNYYNCATLTFVYSIYDPKEEEAIRKMMESNERMLSNEIIIL
jgi:hypothetical protein